MTPKRYIIIGDGAAGTTAAEALRRHDKSATIAILSDDPHAAYFRAALTNYLLGELREEQIWAVPPSFYEEHAIHRALTRVAQVDTKRSVLWLAQGGRPIGYDALLLACGARARPPTFEGAWLPGIMTMRTLQDVHRVMELVTSKTMRAAVVVGGGPLALEWAHGLAHRGVSVTIIVRDQKFLPTAIDNVASDLLLARLRHAGVQVRMGDEVVEAFKGPLGRVGGVRLRGGERLACDLVAVAIGVLCNSEFVTGAGGESGIAVAKNGGVEVDDRMRTTIPNVYAAGDVAAYKGKLLQLWEPARHQARVAAANILGGSETWSPGAHYMATRLYDLDCASIGEVAQPVAGAEELVDFPQRTGRISYRKLVVRDNRLVGALMFGEKEARVRRLGRALKRLVDTKADVSKIRGDLLDPSFDLVGWLNTNELTEKPKQVKPATTAAAAVAQMKGTHAINLSDLPPLPATFARKGATLASATPQASTEASSAGGIAPAFAAPLPPPRVSLEGPPGRIDVQPPSAIVGRDPASAIPLSDPEASFRHAEFTIAGQSVYLRDLGSGSGTWINGRPVTAPKALRDADRVRIGATELTVRITFAGQPEARLSHDAASLQNVGSGEAKPFLDVRSGRALGLGFELAADVITVGRDPASTIRLDDDSIDWRHAWIRRTPAGWDLADAESHGVTKRNGFVLVPNQWVSMVPGDHIEIGEVAMTFAMRASEMLSALLAPASVAYGPREVVPTQGALPAAGGQRLRARISIRQGPGQGSVAELSDVSVIGNDPRHATLVLGDPRLDARHVEITRLEGGFFARDLGSRGGTSCRGQPLGPHAFKLESGDVLVLAQTVALLFEASS